MLGFKRIAHWEYGFYYDKKQDDVIRQPVCSHCGWSKEGPDCEQQAIWKLKECPGCHAEMEEEIEE